MNRRTFIKAVTGTIISSTSMGISLPALSAAGSLPQPNMHDGDIKDYLVKMRFFDLLHSDDVFVEGNDQTLLNSVVFRLMRIQLVIGHGNFHLAGFDEIINVAKTYSAIGQFTAEELAFLEKIFYRDASQYGFMGEKPCRNITDTIDRSKVVKIKNTGHFLYGNESLETFTKIKDDLGNDVILTSGLRGIAKQFLLFLDKARKNDSNLSLASRSLAPPGYSFHSVGDFDVGQADLGGENFSELFTSTEVYRKLLDHGYANLRYQKDNLVGVRFEPWHIKLV
nr:D-alanyl-D-alanine carboxypeptidase family protein [Desulfobulbaceae bacterium]